MKKTVTYFPHDCNARNDERVLELRAKYGAAGYAWWFMCCELMAEAEDGRIKESRLGGYSLSLGLPAEDLRGFLDTCQALGLLIKEGDSWSSERMKQHKEARVKMSQGARRARKKDPEAPAQDPGASAPVGSWLDRTEERSQAPASGVLAVSLDLPPLQDLESSAPILYEALRMKLEPQLKASGSSWDQVCKKWSDTLLQGSQLFSPIQGLRNRQYEASLRKYCTSWIENSKDKVQKTIERRDLKG